jgi:hypothetical protein
VARASPLDNGIDAEANRDDRAQRWRHEPLNKVVRT